MFEKIKEFATDNWVGLTEIGVLIGAEAVICLMYKGYLKRLEEKF